MKLHEAIEKDIIRVVGLIEAGMKESGDNSDGEFESLLDVIISNQGSEMLDPIIAAICERMGRENPWR